MKFNSSPMPLRAIASSPMFVGIVTSTSNGMTFSSHDTIVRPALSTRAVLYSVVRRMFFFSRKLPRIADALGFVNAPGSGVTKCISTLSLMPRPAK